METKDPQDIAMINNDNQMITILISILPEIVADIMLDKWETGTDTFDSMQGKLRDYLARREQKLAGQKKISQVTSSESKNEEENEEPAGEWTYRSDAEYGDYWICTAAKRQRTDDGPEENGNPSRQSDGKAQSGAKSKGKGKASAKGKGKGPKGGCHECQGDHFVRDCPVRAQRKGTGKGKGWDNVPPREWKNWNPGFMDRQWGAWRPNQ